jgi:hypothetical protein
MLVWTGAGRHATQHNDTQKNDTCHNDVEHIIMEMWDYA